MSDNKPKLTKDQQAAVDSRGSAVLVSAAAGSGKTKVIVDRLMSRLTDEKDRCGIDDFLIITYTNAAAAELKSKIIRELSSRIAEDPGNMWLRRQQSRCRGAKISTIHSFCTGVIRENAHKLDLPPDFRVITDGESGIMARQTLEELLEKKYESMDENEGFSSLVDIISAGRDDSRLCETVLDMYTKLQSHPFPEKWASRQIKELELEGVTDAGETAWGRVIKKKLLRAAVYWRDKIGETLDRISAYDDLYKAYGPSLSSTYDDLSKLAGAENAVWDELGSLARIRFERPKNISGYEEFKNIRKKCKADMEKAAESVKCTSDELLEDMRRIAPVTGVLMELVLEFGREYSKEKRRRGVIDFSDQEHMAVALLTDGETGGPSELGREVSRRFAEIMVDEYQDVNAVQEMIFNSVSKDGKNLFMVGDVKQSIYRFRLADPGIFLKKYASFKDYGEAGEGESRKIILSKNFRSRPEILDAANYVFKNIMSTSLGEMEYTEKEYLYPGAMFPESDEPPVELDIIDLKNIDASGGDKYRAEDSFIAERIQKLVGHATVTGKDGLRPAEYGDITVLLRSMRGRAANMAATFSQYGIPVQSEKNESFFEELEVSVMVSLLSVIDNPHQDVELIAVLRSPVYRFTADELAAIRMADRKADFYTALVKAAEENSKCAGFLEELEDYRRAAPDMTVDGLIWYIYDKTGIMGIMGAMNGGEERRENLMRLFEYAVSYENVGYKGLFQFITYLRKLMERGENPGLPPQNESGNAVRITSMHKSKGLEYPIVILAGLSKQFNKTDITKDVLIHSELGAGPKYLDLERRITYPTLSRMAIAAKMDTETLSEEMRVLYVAMTRPKDKLIMVSSVPDGEGLAESYIADGALPVSPYVLEGAKSMGDWILMTALKRPEGAAAVNGAEAKNTENGWNIRIVCPGEDAEPASISAETPEEESESPEYPDITERIRARLSFKYPYPEAGDIPSKITATEIKGRFLDLEAAEDAKPIINERPAPAFERPDFIRDLGGLTGAEKGTALHLVMQYISFDGCSSEEGIKKEVERLENSGILTKAQAASVDTRRIYGYFSSEVGKRVRRAEKCLREFKISLLIDASELYPGAEKDEILLQGIVDCCIEENGELTIIDYKTDYVTEETLESKTAEYRGQIETYSRAMERITGKPVREKILYFFGPGKEIFV